MLIFYKRYNAQVWIACFCRFLHEKGVEAEKRLTKITLKWSTLSCLQSGVPCRSVHTELTAVQHAGTFKSIHKNAPKLCTETAVQVLETFKGPTQSKILFSLEYSTLLRVIILHTKERKCQSTATIYIYYDKFHMAACFDSQ
jgi:hypothetical protein